MPSIPRAPSPKMRMAKMPALPENATDADINDIRIKAQREQLRMVEAEAERGTRRKVDPMAVTVPLLALHIPQRILPLLQKGKIGVAGKVSFREVLEKLKDALHFWLASQHPVIPGMKKKPKLWHVYDIFSVRSLSAKRPLATLRKQAMESYIRMNQIEARGNLDELHAQVSEPLRSQIRERILKRGRSVVEWKFHGEVEPPKCLSLRMIPSIGIADLPESQAAVQQALFKFKTKQSLVIRDARGGSTIAGNDKPRIVTDYIVFEHKNWVPGQKWLPKAQMYDIPTSELKSS
ncbi:hypothetical protein DL93DRAFT_2165531 [Clavulina sp. PMI_390]|nr:hypothetical protein DL93DRAFT_2165531 [Clavulina sp. PMI_390]